MQTIVVDIEDPASSEQPGIAAALACASGQARIVLFHNVYHRRIIDQPGASDQVLDEVRELLLDSRGEQLAKLARAQAGPGASTRLVWAEQGWQELIRFSARAKASLVVLQTQRKSAWQRLTLSNNDWETIRHCPMPLLLAKPGNQSRYDRIIAAVDPLHMDDKPASLDHEILRMARNLSLEKQIELTVINAVVPNQAAPLSGLGTGVAVSEVSEAVLKAHRDAVGTLLRDVNCDNASIHTCINTPEDEIVLHARKARSPLVIMGAVSRSRLQRLLIGSTAERVLDRLDCDALIVKPDDFGTNMPAVTALLTNEISPMARSLIG